ncbi:PAS domain S-box-containing protein/diguanylate cyclase (GGDEF) domain-containing protein [Nocardia amikacinitolerans]|uniref:PAS domain S-box-containing protein/diguanylate cyclase (GGDEF) domain-containing protein n=1 Tax=Nocardia amikacinitolerans TaxID=756689 RepID=A0A285LY66_9NOCA|nr:PAS domain S-box-containing protein/diguanylate cyclase (GGDEF) domain-containing protein [Nocardia amikacinitolerans]MCP2299331.1 PAS domain S-box-containing protein/diguanylate cyclase (GGDEF) domain-containing protein [Nocardia amikacinitolerans]SNY89795.1 PAS domain S-box-containing protein/diguanylate cyclase (GGDEF) domain-containing protein [Nocardia amikacinitolerans]
MAIGRSTIGGLRVGEETTGGVVDAEQLAQRYRSLIEHTPDGICVHENGVIVYVNQATVRLLAARSADEVVGQPLTRFVHPDSIPAMRERIELLTSKGTASVPTEMLLLRTDGETVPVETVSVLTPWHDHFAYQVVIHDLTAQRAAEDAQRRAEQHFTTVVSQLEEGVVVIDRGGRIESANPAAHRIFGGDERHGDIVGRTIDELPMVLLDANAQPLPPSRHPMARTLATGETITGYIFGVDRRDGQRRWLSGSSRLLNPGDPDSPAVSSFADITEFRASRRQLEYQATHDALTGLANRSLILSQLANALATSEDLPYSTVLFIDLDGFKAINDTLGHAIGDTVLQIVAQRLQRALRADDLVGRLGGDEFLVLLSGRARRVDLDVLVNRLRSTMSEPIIARGHRIAVDASVGVTELVPGDRRTPEAVLHDADVAMYQAKPPGQRDRSVAKGRTNNTHAS